MRRSLLPLALLLLPLACKGQPDSSAAPTGPEDSAEHCAALDADACGADPKCWLIEGRRVNPDEGCLEEPSFTACAPAGLACSAAVVMARHEGGECWWFSSGCLPEAGWSADVSCQEPTGEWPRCGE